MQEAGHCTEREETVSTRPGALDILLRLSPQPGLTKRLTIVRTSRILATRYGHQVTKTLKIWFFYETDERHV